MNADQKWSHREVKAETKLPGMCVLSASTKSGTLLNSFCKKIINKYNIKQK